MPPDDVNGTKVDPGIFGNPRTVCKLGKYIDQPPTGRIQFKVVTWNVQGWAMQPRFVPDQASLLLTYDADFILTQEDMYGWDMQRALGEGTWCFMGETRNGRSCDPTCPSRVPLSSNGGDGEHTFVYFNCKKWQVLETSTYYMGFFQNDGYPRIFTNGLFQHLETRHLLWLTSTHLPRKAEVDGQKVCIQALKMMGDQARGSSILAGDFNIIESSAASPMYRPLKEGGFIFDSYDVCPQCRTCHDGYDKHFGTFAGFGMWCDQAASSLSDHNPIIATYQIG